MALVIAQLLGLLTRNARQSDPAIPVRALRPSPSIGAFGADLTVVERPEVAVSFPYSIHPRLATTSSANGGTVTWNGGRATLQTGVSNGGVAKLESRKAARYVPGVGVIARFTAVFLANAANSRQEIGIGDDNDGYFFGYNGTSFGVLRRVGGVDNWVPQANWNGDDKLDGTGPSGHTLDPTKGYPYMIQYRWLGHGAIRYYIEDPVIGSWVLVHTILFAGSSVTPSVNNPSLPLHAKVVSLGSTSNLTLYTASMGAIEEGDISNVSIVPFSFSRFLIGAPVDGQAVMSLRSKPANVLGGINTNRVSTHLTSISIRAASNKDLYVQIILGATVGGVPSFTDINTTQSVMEVDVAGTTVTGGVVGFQMSVAGGTSETFDLTGANLIIRPGELATVAMFAEATTVDGRVSLNWHEEL